MKYITCGLSILTFLVYVAAFGYRGGLPAVFFFAPFTLLPLVVGLILAWKLKATWAQAIILASTILYVAWFTYVYIDVTQIHIDANGSLAFLFVAIYASPVLVLMWLAAVVTNYLSQKPAHHKVLEK